VGSNPTLSASQSLKFPLFLSIAPKLQLFRPYCSRYALPFGPIKQVVHREKRPER
jgi:hypothetical protein